MVFKFIIQMVFFVATVLVLPEMATVLAVAPDTNDNCEHWSISGECDAVSPKMKESCDGRICMTQLFYGI